MKDNKSKDGGWYRIENLPDGLIPMGKFIFVSIQNILNETINDMLDFGHKQTKKGD